jgi:glycosyltransferase involved in cell wall biosynthesis
MADLRIGLDATPLLGVRTGVGRYVEHLLTALADTAEGSGLKLCATAFSVRGLGELPRAVPAGVATRSRPVSANLLQQLWMRAELPSLETVTGLRVDVMHGTNYVLPPARHARGVLTIHDLAFLRFPGLVDTASRRFRVLVPRGLRRAAVVITPSQATADDVADAYAVPADRLVVTPLGVAPAWLSATAPDGDWRRTRGLPGNYLLAVGTLEPRKGLDVLLSALRVLAARGVDAPLVLVGQPGWGPALDRAGVRQGQVIELGYLDEAALRPVVAGASCLVFPSRYEGFGLPPLEALAAGTPVVASDLAVCREVLGPHARYAPVGDVEALADAIAATLERGGPTSEADRRAHAAAHTWAACAQATRRAYELAAS